jgi:hypothetical protein
MVARWVGRRRASTVRSPNGEPGSLVAVRVRWCAGTTGVAGALLRHYDAGFREQGFSIAEIMAGFLRRATRQGRSVTVVLDDLSAGCPEIGPVVRALTAPERFLPEGVDHAVPIALILAGTSGARGAASQIAREGLPPPRHFHLPAYPPEVIRRIIAERYAVAVGAEPADALVERLAGRVELEGRGASRALELLRRELLEEESIPRMVPVRPERWASATFLEPHMAAALAATGVGVVVELGALRATAGRLARSSGERPLAPTTFWRRIVRLEQAGLLTREVRSGGQGGSRCQLRLLGPLPVPGQAIRRRGTLPASARCPYEGVAPVPTAPEGVPGVAGWSGRSAPGAAAR